MLINRTVIVTPHCHCRVQWVTGGTHLFWLWFLFYWASCSQLLLEAGNLSKLWRADAVCALNWLCFSTYSHAEAPPGALRGGCCHSWLRTEVTAGLMFPPAQAPPTQLLSHSLLPRLHLQAHQPHGRALLPCLILFCGPCGRIFRALGPSVSIKCGLSTSPLV